jgi:hypothetical protein
VTESLKQLAVIMTLVIHPPHVAKNRLPREWPCR